jgi:hypothetical protein
MPISDQADVWTRRDTLFALGWFAIALAARSFLLARVEGVLEHDQAIVGLMALDIAEGRRLPIFFDGQRYMGAVEAYTAAIFVKLFGHTPLTVALAPTFYFGLLAAGQFAAWRRWSSRATGHLAALFTVVCSPFLALWSVVPRGGYTEVLAWGLATLAVYRCTTQPDRPPFSRAAQFGWGCLFTLGYFINPLSLVVYLAMALDWTFVRHGADLKRLRGLGGRWPDRPWAPLAWTGLALAGLILVSAGCHVKQVDGGQPQFVFGLGLLPGSAGRLVGIGLVLGTFAFAAWWTGLAQRLFRELTSYLSFATGAVLGLSPFLIYNLRVKFGLAPYERSLPVWIRAPWEIGPNICDGIASSGPLFAGQTRGGSVPFLCLPLFRLPDVAWPEVTRGLALVTPLVILVIVGLIAAVALRDRASWREVWSLRVASVPPATVLASTGLGCSLGLYLVQASSLDGSSIRYLLPAWIFLPGLLASGLLACRKWARATALACLLGVWCVGQVNLFAEMGSPNPERKLAERLEAEGVRVIVANGALVQVIADLSAGRVGGLEYRSHWPRIGDRYTNRFPADGPIICVVDLDRIGDLAGDEPGPRLREIIASLPGQAHLVAAVERYQVWLLDLTLAEFLDERGVPLPERPASAIVAR